MTPLTSTTPDLEPRPLGSGPLPPQATRALRDLREAVDRLLGSVFYGPLLSTMRRSTLKGTIGHGGRGEEIFQNQLDQIIAERAGQASGSPSTGTSLSQTLFDRFARAAADNDRIRRAAQAPRLEEYVATQDADKGRAHPALRKL